MTRNGKIARLPRHVREELNQRLEDGRQGKELVKWLNGLREVKNVMAFDFGGRQVSEQNLSEWKQGGFREWQRQRQIADGVRGLVEHADELNQATADLGIADQLASVLAAELAVAAQAILGDTSDPKERWQYLRQALRQLHLLRKQDQRAARARVEAQRWEIECEERLRQEERDVMSAAREYIMAPLKRPTLVKAFGGGEAGEKAADFVLEVQREYGVPNYLRAFLDKNQPPATLPPDQAESKSIKPDQTKNPPP